jgi:methylmalonyl-CoA mutase
MTTSTPDQKLASAFPAADLETWHRLVEKALKGADFNKRLVTRTADGIAIRPLYTRQDEIDGSAESLPGAAPLTRGNRVQRFGLGWDIRAFHSETDPKAANAAILADLEGGVNSIALHVGPTALPASRDAITAALDGVLLDVCPIALIAGGATFDAAIALNALWDEKQIGAVYRQGQFNADPIGTLAKSGGLAEPVDTALARAIALLKVSEAFPHVTALAADGTVYHNAGASEAQELAAMLATLVAYLRAADDAGTAPAQALPKIAVTLAADADEFAAIAKVRAARRLIWRVAHACGAAEAASNVTYTMVTSYRMMAKRDPWTNILRTTIACAGAAIGGADSIIVLPFTYALGKPDDFARRVARNIQIVCQEESHLGRVTDPAGGSWYIENLTEELAKSAWQVFQQIEAQGGMLAALQSGFVQDAIAATADKRAKDIANGRVQLTGVSAFPLLGDDGVKTEPWPATTDASLPAVTVPPLPARRLGEAFEALRDAADAAGGYTVFVASMGPIAEHNVRSTWTKNYLAAGGIATLISDGYLTAGEAADAFRASGATAACICSSDAIYETLAADTAKALKAAGARLVLMAGKPGEREAEYRSAGVDQFLFAGTDAVAILADLHSKLG